MAPTSKYINNFVPNNTNWTAFNIQVDGWYRLVADELCKVQVVNENQPFTVNYTTIPDLQVIGFAIQDLAGLPTKLAGEWDNSLNLKADDGASNSERLCHEMHCVKGDVVWVQGRSTGSVPNDLAFCYLGTHLPRTRITTFDSIDA